MVTSIVQGLLRTKITEGRDDGEYEGANANFVNRYELYYL